MLTIIGLLALISNKREAIKVLGNERLWKRIDTLKTEVDIPAIMRDAIGFEQIVPDTEGDTKVNTVSVFLRPIFGMVPDMHLWIVKYILKRAEIDREVRVIKMADRQGKYMDHKKIVDAKPDHR